MYENQTNNSIFSSTTPTPPPTPPPPPYSQYWTRYKEPCPNMNNSFYQLNMKSRSLAEENAKDPVSQLITNKFAMRRLDEHKSAINVTKTLVNKTFE